MSDLVSRQAAVDALRTCYDTETVTMDNGDEYINYGDAVGEIESLPSAQPNIILCKDCKYYGRVDKRRFYRGMDCLNKNIGTIVPDKDFCSKAERRTE